jgi:hypothetical protein
VQRNKKYKALRAWCILCGTIGVRPVSYLRTDAKLRVKNIATRCNFSTIPFVPLQNHFVYEEDNSFTPAGG